MSSLDRVLFPLLTGALALGSLSGCGNGSEPPTPCPVNLQVTTPICDGDILKPTEHALEGQVTAGCGLDGYTAEFQVSGPAGTSNIPGVIDETGAIAGLATFEQQGTYTVTLIATDGLNIFESEGSVCAVANGPPEGQITAPTVGEAFTEEDTITFSAQVSDGDDVPEDLVVVWSSSKDGELGTSTPDGSGFATLEVPSLSVFNHLVSMRVSDPWGATAEETITVSVTECLDRDGDGFTECSEDCDDRDEAIHPDADEVCDGVDNDCNGEIDELGDEDGDGYAVCKETCTGVSCILDCDDTDITINPDAIEICDGKDNNCNGFADEGHDIDQDGYLNCLVEGLQKDCDDLNPNVCPGCTEVCDGATDEDCDQAIDEGLSTSYCADTDIDGYGDPNNAQSFCGLGVAPGFVTNCDDCDDSNASVSPVQVEACDGLDNDCDTGVDEGQTLSYFYQDLDGDTFGDVNVPVQACVAPPGAVANSDDCNDGDPTINPNGVEVCDGADQNCNSLIDEGALLTFYEDADTDGYGHDSATTEACSAPIGYVSQPGDCGPADNTTYPGAPERCDVVDNDCDSTVDEGASNTYYVDNDADGYGNANATAMGCEVPNDGKNYVEQAGDCDDGNGSINPDAAETCNYLDDDCDSTADEAVRTTYCADADGDGFGDDADTLKACELPDGYSVACGDCDDSRADSSPAGAELCDGRDNDCNGTIDNGLPVKTFYVDADGDGFGVEDQTIEACEAPEGYVEITGDCDDTRPGVYPGKAEACNGKDNDCDGKVDEGVRTTFWRDRDLDGYGNAEEPYAACLICETCSENDDDCDDTDALTYPGAPEIFDGSDNDCDGELERDVPMGSAVATIAGLEQGDRAGSSLDGLGDFDGDGIVDFAFGAPRHDERRGEIYVVYGREDGWGPMSARNVGSVLSSPSLSEAGTSITGADLDRDNIADLIVGAPKYDSMSTDVGRVSIIYGGAGRPNGDLLSLESASVAGYFPSVNMGMSVDGHGDVTCDGIDDLLIGAPWPWATQIPPFAGIVFVLPGSVERYGGGLNNGAGGSDLIQVYGGANQIIGLNVAHVGDVGGSMCGDFLAMGHGQVTGLNGYGEGGVVYVVEGGEESDLPQGTILNAEDLDLANYIGSAEDELMGLYADGLGDINNDGYDDFILGREEYEAGGRLGLIFYGGSLPGGGNFPTADTVADVTISTNSGLQCPCTVSEIGDVNGDDLVDIALGVPDSGEGGTVYVFFGRAGGLPNNLIAELDADVVLHAENVGDGAGTQVAGIGDVNGDGSDDFAVSAIYADGEEGGAGKVYVFFGY